MVIRAVFLDRDGTINVDTGHVHHIDDFEFLPGAIEGLQMLHWAKKMLIVVSNQAGIAKGLFSENDLSKLHGNLIHQLLLNRVNLAGNYFCPHHPEATVPRYRKDCDCRKPKPGLLVAAMRERGIAASEAVMVGDKNSDVEAGRALGMITYLVETGYGKMEKRETNATYVVPNLLIAAQHILGYDVITPSRRDRHAGKPIGER